MKISRAMEGGREGREGQTNASSSPSLLIQSRPSPRILANGTALLRERASERGQAGCRVSESLLFRSKATTLARRAAGLLSLS